MVYFPKVVIMVSSILQALLQCGLDLSHEEMESNSPSLGSGLLTVTLLCPIKWDRSNAVGFLRPGWKCDNFLRFLEACFPGALRLLPLWNQHPVLPFDLGKCGCLKSCVLGCCYILENLLWNFLRPIWHLGLVGLALLSGQDTSG